MDTPHSGLQRDFLNNLAWGAELLLPGFRPGRMEAHPSPERTAQGFWSGTSVEKSHITVKELKAVHFGILAFAEQLRGVTESHGTPILFALRNYGPVSRVVP